MKDYKYISVCEEDILNLENAVKRLIDTASNEYEPIEVFSIQEIIRQFRDKTIVHCKTKSQFNKVVRKFLKSHPEDYYLNKWDVNKEDSCIDVSKDTWTYGSNSFYRGEGRKIISSDKYLAGK